MPLDAVFADISGNPTNVSGHSMSDGAIDHAAVVTYEKLAEAGLSGAEIMEMLRATEPFLSNWARVEKTLSEMAAGSTAFD